MSQYSPHQGPWDLNHNPDSRGEILFDHHRPFQPLTPALTDIPANLEYLGRWRNEKREVARAARDFQWSNLLHHFRDSRIDNLVGGTNVALELASIEIAHGLPLLVHLCREKAPLDVIERVLKLGVPADTQARLSSLGVCRPGSTGLHVAGFQGNLPLWDLLVRYGASPSARDDLGDTPVSVMLASPHRPSALEASKIAARHPEAFSISSATGSNPLATLALGNDPVILSAVGAAVRGDPQARKALIDAATIALENRKLAAISALHHVLPDIVAAQLSDDTVVTDLRKQALQTHDYAALHWLLATIKPNLIFEVSSREFTSIQHAALTGKIPAQKLWEYLAADSPVERGVRLLDQYSKNCEAFFLSHSNYADATHESRLRSQPSEQTTAWVRNVLALINPREIATPDRENCLVSLVCTPLGKCELAKNLADLLRFEVGVGGVEIASTYKQLEIMTTRLRASIPTMGSALANTWWNRIESWCNYRAYSFLFEDAEGDLLVRDFGDQENPGLTTLQLALAARFLDPEPLKALLERGAPLQFVSTETLSSVDLRETNLNRIPLAGMSLTNTDLRNSDLRYAEVERIDLSAALYNDRTKFPPGFDPRKHAMIHAVRDREFLLVSRTGATVKTSYERIEESLPSLAEQHIANLSFEFDEFDGSAVRRLGRNTLHGPAGRYYNYLLREVRAQHAGSERALAELVPALVAGYPIGIASNILATLEGHGIKADKDHPYMAEMMALLSYNYPWDRQKTRRFPEKGIFYDSPDGPDYGITLDWAVDQITYLAGFLKNLTFEVPEASAYNWARIGTHTWSFKKLRYDAQRIKLEDGSIGPSLLEQFGFEPLRPTKFGGSGFRFNPVGKDLVVSLLDTARGHQNAPFDQQTTVIERRGFYFIGHPDHGALIIRNSSPVFGRDKMRGPAYWCPPGTLVGANFDLNEFTASLALRFGFTAVMHPALYRDLKAAAKEIIDLFSNAKFQREMQIKQPTIHMDFLIGHLDAVQDAFRRWKFDTNPLTAFQDHPRAEGKILTGGFLSPGFKATVSLLESAERRGRPLELAFVHPKLPPWRENIYDTPLGDKSSRLVATGETLQTLRQLADTGQASNEQLDRTGIRNFLQQAGFAKSSELIIVQPGE